MNQNLREMFSASCESVAWSIKGNAEGKMGPNLALEDVPNKVSGVWDQKTQNLAGMRSQQINFPLETIKLPLNIRTNIKSVMGMLVFLVFLYQSYCRSISYWKH